MNGGNKENVCLHPEHVLGDCRSRPHLTLDRGRVRACTPTHLHPHSFYKGLYTHPSPLNLQGSPHTHTPTRSTRIFTHTYTPLFILQGSLHTHTHTHTHTYLLILKGLYRRPLEIYSGSQSVFFISTAGLLSSGQTGSCPQSGQKVTGVEQKRTSPGVPGQRALAPSSRLCFWLAVCTADLSTVQVTEGQRPVL